MTLQNGCTHGHKAYLWCDTAYWDGQTGELACYDTKAFHGLHWPFAGTLSTWGGNPIPIAEYIGGASPEGLDDLLAVTADALRLFVAKGGGGRVLIASHDGNPRLHMIASDQIWPGYDAFEPVELDYFTSSGNDSAAYKVAARRGFNPKRMRRLIDVQCETPFAGVGALADLGERVWIGGNIVRIEVGPDGATSTVERAVERAVEPVAA